MKLLLKRYKSYKDSDINWLGEVPEHWKARRLKDVVKVNPTYRIPYDLPKDTQVEFVPMTNVNEYFGEISKYDIVPLETVASGYTRFQTNDVIFAKITPCMENGNSAIARNSRNRICFGSTEFFVYQPHSSLDVTFLHYFLHNGSFRKNAEPFMKGSAGQKRVTTLYMSTHYFPLPPLIEQEAIVSYLNENILLIDQKVKLLEGKTASYRKLRQSLINETVTCGLDKTAPLKESGIDWIEKTPKHWEVKRIGSEFTERRERVNDTDYPPLSVTMNGIVPQLDNAAKTDHNDNRKRVAVGDFVINSRSDRRGSSGLSPLDGSVSVINIALKPCEGNCGKYYHYLFKSYRFIEEFYRMGRGIVDDLWTTKSSIMKTIEFAFPPLPEQEAIAKYLDEKTAKIDNIVETIETQSEVLKELRKTLINDVVTGKIKVLQE